MTISNSKVRPILSIVKVGNADPVFSSIIVEVFMQIHPIMITRIRKGSGSAPLRGDTLRQGAIKYMGPRHITIVARVIRTFSDAGALEDFVERSPLICHNSLTHWVFSQWCGATFLRYIDM